MKNIKKLFSILICAVMVFSAVPFTSSLTASAEEFTQGYYTYSVSDGEATITDCDKSISGDIIIPSELGGYPVTTIGSSAFYYCRKITSIKIPKSVKVIEARAFSYCTDAISIDIPYGVTSIGEEAFRYCTGLKSVTLPGSLTRVSKGAFGLCENLISVTISNNISIIEGHAFTNCYNLKSLKIGKDVEYIGERAFYRSENIEFIEIPDGVTSIGYEAFARCEKLQRITLPYTLKEIGNRAFEDCASLLEVTIPNGVTKISNYLFQRCTSLKSVLITSSVKEIHKYAFNECNNLTIITSQGSYAEDFAIANKIPVKYYKNTIMVPLEVPKDDKNFAMNYVEYSTGKIIDNVDSQYDLKNLTAKKDGYYSIDIEDCTLDIHRSKSLALVPQNTDSGISAVHANGRDILANELKTTDNNNTTVKINVYPAKGISVAEYQLLHENTAVAKSKDGLITFDSNELQASDKYYVRIIDTNGKKYKKLKINYVNEPAIDIDFDLENILELTIPDSVPLIGGKDIELSLEDLPVNFKFRDNSLYVALGAKYVFSKEDDDFEQGFVDYRNLIDKVFNDMYNDVHAYRNARELRSWGMWEENSKSDLGGSISACGYVQIQLDSTGKPVLKSGKIVFSVSVSHSFEWQTVIVAVPIVIKVSGEIGVDASVTLGLADNGKMYITGDLGLTLPKITASAGIGVAKVADISVYGSAKNNVYINFRTPYTTLTLSGELGISGKVLFWSGKLPILSGSWEYYNSLKAKSYSLRRTVMSQEQIVASMADEMNYKINRGYLSERTEWNSEPKVQTYSLRRTADSGYSVTTVEELQSGIYDGANPKTAVLNNGTRIMVWTEDIADRSDYNHTAAVYSVYNPDLKYWSEPQIIADDATADFTPEIATDGERVFAVWSNANKQFDGEVDMSVIAAACEISYAEFDVENAVFTQAGTITNDGYYDLNPKVCVNNGTAYISWVKNIANSPLTLEGENRVYKAAIGNTTEVTEVYKSNVPVTEQSVGILGGKPYVAFVTDSDGDYATTSDMVVYLSSDTKTVVLSDSAEQGNVIFSEMDNENVLMWYKNGNLVSYNLNAEKTLIEGFGVSKFSVINGNNQTAVVYSKQNLEDESDSAGLYAVIYGENGFSKPVCINAKEGVYADSANGYIDQNGNYRIVFVRKNVTIENDDITELVTLCDAVIVPDFDVSLEDVFYSEDGIQIDEDMTVTAVVKNNGLYNAEGLKFTVTDTNGNEIYSTEVDTVINAGEQAEIEFKMPFPNIIAPTNYTVSVSLLNGEEAKESDNLSLLRLGYSDVSLEVENIVSGNSQGALITVNNNGRTDEKVILKIYEDSKDGKLLGVYELGTVKADSTVYYNYSAQKLRFLEAQSDILYFEIETSSTEKHTGDNSGYITYKTAMLELGGSEKVEYYYDMNDDEEFDILDLIRMANMLTDTENEEMYSGRDITGDEILNSLDLTSIKKKLWELF